MGAVIQRHSLNWEVLDSLYEAAVQAVDEAVINALVQGEEVPTGQTGLGMWCQHWTRTSCWT